MTSFDVCSDHGSALALGGTTYTCSIGAENAGATAGAQAAPHAYNSLGRVHHVAAVSAKDPARWRSPTYGEVPTDSVAIGDVTELALHLPARYLHLRTTTDYYSHYAHV